MSEHMPPPCDHGTPVPYDEIGPWDQAMDCTCGRCGQLMTQRGRVWTAPLEPMPSDPYADWPADVMLSTLMAFTPEGK